MLTSLLLYLAEASFCLIIFALAYRLLLAGLTHFVWNRAYLLGALATSVVIPLLAFPGLAAWLANPAAAPGVAPLPLRLGWQLTTPLAHAAATPTASGPDWLALLLIGAVIVYGLGALYKLMRAVRNVRVLRKLARQNPQTDLGSFAIVHLPEANLPAFSFGRHVFLSPLHEGLSPAEQEQLLLHEQVHVRQRHTLDLLLVEALGVVFWFNGAVAYLGRQLKVVHEYLADAAVARTQVSATPYGELLIKLAAQQLPFALVHAFSHKQIFLRIHMLTQPTSSPMKKLRFLFIAPVFAFTWAATTCVGSPASETTAPAEASATSTTAPVAAAGRIGRISWQGNTYLTAAELNQGLGLKPGDAYDSAAVARRLSFDPKGSDITSRYMDHGYLFFLVAPTATRQPDGTTDLAFNISEGRKAQIGRISITGNTKTSTAALLKLIPLRSGEDFSRAKLLETQRILAQQGQFDPNKVGINPAPEMRPNESTDLVNIALVVVEKAK
ncbi:M56 family metallopeptidase [Hymenobacter ruber]